MSDRLDTIMVFAAGLGSRMNSLTATKPKSLITILGKPILEYTFDLLRTYPFKRVVINSHYFAEQITDFVNSYNWGEGKPDICLIHEPALLETAGGVHNASHFFEGKPIFTLNSDVIITSKANPFEAMNQIWSPDRMDFLLLMQPFDKAVGYRGKGDFEIAEGGKLHRPDLLSYSYMYSGLGILKPNLIGPEAISLKEYYFNHPKVYGTVIEGMKWYHATSPEDLPAIESALKKERV